MHAVAGGRVESWSLALLTDGERYLTTACFAVAQSLGPFFIVVTCTLWALLPIFWGSTLLLEHYFYRLNIFVVDFDSQAVGAQNALAGPPITQSLIMLNSKVGPHLTYQVVPPAHFPGGPSQVMEAVGHNEAWGAVVINGNATTAWRSAIENGDAAYDPTGSVGVYFSGAHFYQIVLLYVAPIMKTNVVTALIEASDAAARTFLQTAISANNATAVSMAARAPQTLGNVFGMFTYDVRPITAWAVGRALLAFEGKGERCVHRKRALLRFFLVLTPTASAFPPLS